MTTKGKNIPAYALTTRERVKDRLQITDNAFDDQIDRLIKQVSDYIQGVTNINFLFQKYTNEVYSVYGIGQDCLLLNQSNVFQLKIDGVTQAVGSSLLSGLSNTNGAAAGMLVIGDGIPSGSKIVSVTDTTITIDKASTIATSTGYIIVNGIASFQYRSGQPTTPAWTDFLPDQYELVEDGETGIIRVYGGLSFGRFVNNSVRVTYWAGYLIDWENEIDRTKHTLPGDLTMLAENLITRFWIRRKNAGKASEAIQGATVSWDRELDAVDKDLLNNYTRIPRFY